MVRAEIINGSIVITIPEDVLKFVTEQHPDFWDGISDMDTPNLVIEDMVEWRKEIMHGLNYESGDGSTPITRLIDKIIVKAVDDGAFGINIEASGLA